MAMFDFLKREEEPSPGFTIPAQAQASELYSVADIVTVSVEASAPSLAERSGIVVISNPLELPRFESVISGTDNKALVRLTTEQMNDIAVIRTNSASALIIAAEHLHGNVKNVTLFQQIRNQLSARQMEVERVIWARKELIESLRRSRSVETGQTVAESTQVRQTEPGRLFSSWIEYAVRENATDIHIMVRGQAATVKCRIDGELEPLRNGQDGNYLPSEVRDAIALVYNKLMESRSGSHSQFMPGEFLYCMIPYEIDGKKITLRFQSIREVGGYDVIMRVLKLGDEGTKLLQFDDLGYEASQCEMLELASSSPSGLILIAGVTGSGKSTTLKTLMESIPGRDGMKLYSVEDPVEYKIKGVTQIPIQRNVKDPESGEREYRVAYASLMRADPDAIMLGELRDGISGNAALTQAETGHMALGTVHANSVIGIIQRLTSPAIGLDLHALTAPGILNLIVYQALVPLLCGDCKIPLTSAPLDVQKKMTLAAQRFRVDISKVHVKNPNGCPRCRQRGTAGMSVVSEMISPDRQFLKLMRERREFDAEDHWRSLGDGRFDSSNMVGKTVFEHALLKALQGKVDPSQCERFDKFERFEIRNAKQTA